ncbi:hypothetical protein [Candidatus Tisiphia endosymbiont of Hybos culiciformis]|uniref:hypothetical protein n=1 Tax=Candidatus Tisiphia endosymbiont of Hybos culiciformis TaxID=3139331 RepID=UPI003CCB3EA9
MIIDNPTNITLNSQTFISDEAVLFYVIPAKAGILDSRLRGNDNLQLRGDMKFERIDPALCYPCFSVGYRFPSQLGMITYNCFVDSHLLVNSVSLPWLKPSRVSYNLDIII